MYTLPVPLQEHLKFYVYLFLHPETKAPVYIGKGSGNRVCDHLQDSHNLELRALIETYGLEQIWRNIYLIHNGLEEGVAHQVETACIDLVHVLGYALANVVRGKGAERRGLRPVSEWVLHFTPAPLVVQHPMVSFTINREYKHDLHPEALYEFSRGVWRANVEHHAIKPEYALAIFNGIVREVYKIDHWHPAGTLPYLHRTLSPEDLVGRYEFSGRVAEPEVRELYLGKQVPKDKSSQNPVRYWL